MSGRNKRSRDGVNVIGKEKEEAVAIEEKPLIKVAPPRSQVAFIGFNPVMFKSFFHYDFWVYDVVVVEM